ncbi:MAG: hypothetical protein M5R41_04295 [Bacteroidia bacterium]|nr:hypothetical protein [Bacteroidia bacterium]
MRRGQTRQGALRTGTFRLVVVLPLLFVAPASAQRVPAEDAIPSLGERVGDVPFPGIWAMLRRALLPEPLGIMYELRGYITDLELTEPRTQERDLRLLDALFDHAVYLAEGDIQAALLALTWATLPYHRFPAVVPLLGWTITVPVSTESRSDFQRRLANLPGLLLPDTPPSLDRDKLPHFFGSAYLQTVVNEPSLADVLGYGVEWFEQVFKLEGFHDDRDIMVNRMGIVFAMQLQRQRAVRPSDIFHHWSKNNESSTHPDR